MAFCFTAIIFDRQLMNFSALGDTVAGFGLFCLFSGAVYIINDIADIRGRSEAPRQTRASNCILERYRSLLHAWALICDPGFRASQPAYVLSPDFALFAILLLPAQSGLFFLA
jgi:hypothetical protein